MEQADSIDCAWEEDVLHGELDDAPQIVAQVLDGPSVLAQDSAGAVISQGELKVDGVIRLH